jgi:hypothetical protein
MLMNEIRVSQSQTGLWHVLGKRTTHQSFPKKYSAVAYARALAHEQRRTLYIDGPDGFLHPQTRASLTYPVFFS